ncbi:MAG TPA: polysaccharide biosynthesis/export family protein [Bacteroidia bacterium]|jgi:polysaccharide export outer membrane protein|nr:polysaccharide biosynthesis/export family protein [Bacteroidia bacterium]HQF27601.1 polysaccharide biosynthesis/export family protein [Bacteroidia bacterium]HQK96678.1 polysaccharide biosynthesis/export family protein [Bacteroidia bacterium]
MRKAHYLLIMSTLALLLSSCRHVKDVTYFQASRDTSSKKVTYPNFDKGHEIKTSMYEAIIQPNDILSIYVSSLSQEASSFFNTITKSERPDFGDSYSTRPNVGYMVDVNGYIEMPLVGKVKLAGLTTTVARDTLQKRLEQYLQSPNVRLYFENFKVTILGEVTHPGVFSVTNEKITVPEAIGMAGDLNIYGNRRDVLLIREENGVKTYTKIDLTRRDLFTAPYYYLHSNDILYVPPVKDKLAQSDNFYRVAPMLISLGTLLAFVLINR